MRLEVADHEVGALLGGQPGVAEHLVGLADAGCGAEVEAQESAQAGRGGHAPSVGRARTARHGPLCALQTPAAVLSGAFAREPYGRGMDIFAVAFTLVLFGVVRRLPARDRAAVSTSQVIGLIVTIGLFIYFIVALVRPERF